MYCVSITWSVQREHRKRELNIAWLLLTPANFNTYILHLQCCWNLSINKHGQSSNMPTQTLRSVTTETEFTSYTSVLCVISGFRHDVDEIRALLGYSRALNGNSVPTFQDKLTVPSRVKKYKKNGLLDLWRWGRYVVPKRRYGIAIQRCVKSYKGADFKINFVSVFNILCYASDKRWLMIKMLTNSTCFS